MHFTLGSLCFGKGGSPRGSTVLTPLMAMGHPQDIPQDPKLGFSGKGLELGSWSWDHVSVWYVDLKS